IPQSDAPACRLLLVMSQLGRCQRPCLCTIVRPGHGRRNPRTYFQGIERLIAPADPAPRRALFDAKKGKLTWKSRIKSLLLPAAHLDWVPVRPACLCKKAPR